MHGGTYYNDEYTPICLPFTAEYDDHGGYSVIKNKEFVLADINQHNYFEIDKERADCERYVQATINSPEDICRYARNDLYVDLYETKFPVTLWMCHKGAYDTILASVKARKDYFSSKTFEEKTKGLIHQTLLELKTTANKMRDTYKHIQYADIHDDVFFIKLSNASYRLSISTPNSGYDPMSQYLFGMLSNNHTGYINEVMDYICFVNALELLRMGFYTQSGAGSQDNELDLHEVLSIWKIEYIRIQKKIQEEEWEVPKSGEDAIVF